MTRTTATTGTKSQHNYASEYFARCWATKFSFTNTALRLSSGMYTIRTN